MSISESTLLPPFEAFTMWAEAAGVPSGRLPSRDRLEEISSTGSGGLTCRPAVDDGRVDEWELRHGQRLPRALNAWLRICDGLFLDGPLIHPLSAIGPMVPFATFEDLIVQPESWLELGNPGVETVCIDLAYRWPGGDCPIFASGDDLSGTPPRIIATGFAEWLIRLVHEGGRSFWLDDGFRPLGDPWVEHRRRVPAPTLPDRLRHYATRLRPLLRPHADERAIAHAHGLTRGDVEEIFRYLQHQAS